MIDDTKYTHIMYVSEYPRLVEIVEYWHRQARKRDNSIRLFNPVLHSKRKRHVDVVLEHINKRINRLLNYPLAYKAITSSEGDIDGSGKPRFMVLYIPREETKNED